MKEYKDIDHLIKESASGFKPHPGNKVWDGIANEIGTQKLNRTSYRWMAAIILLLLVSGAAVWFFNSGNNTVSNKVIIADTNNPENTTINNILDKNENETGTKVADNEVVKLKDKEQITKSPIIINESQQLINNEEEMVLEIVNDNNISNEEEDMVTSDNINFIRSSSIYNIANADYKLLKKKIDVEDYMIKRQKMHTYTGLSAKAAMMYYPNTTDQFTYTVDAEFGIIMQNFYIQSGIGYQKVKERGVYNYYYKSNDSIGYYNKVISFEINPLNPDEITYKTTKTTVYDSLEHLNTQSPLFYYNYVNVPLKVGYRFKKFDRLSLTVETGVIFSKLLDSKIPQTAFYIPESTLLKVEDKTPLRKDFNYQFVLGLRVNYKLFNSITVTAEPEFTKYLNSIYETSSDYTLTRPYSMGLRFGIYYDF